MGIASDRTDRLLGEVRTVRLAGEAAVAKSTITSSAGTHSYSPNWSSKFGEFLGACHFANARIDQNPIDFATLVASGFPGKRTIESNGENVAALIR